MKSYSILYIFVLLLLCSARSHPPKPPQPNPPGVPIIIVPFERWYTAHSWDPYWPPEQSHPMDRKAVEADIWKYTF